jgi:hypothetical protein
MVVVRALEVVRNITFIGMKVLLNLAPDLINFNPYNHVFFLVRSLVLDFFNQVPNCPSDFNIYAIKLLIDQINSLKLQIDL